MDFMTAKQAAEAWGISSRRVALLCEQGRIEGVKKAGAVWLIPPDAQKPKDERIKSGKYIKTKKIKQWNKNIKTVGIIGAGHLGRVFADVLIKNGFDKSCLKISYAGNPSTFENLKQNGFTSCITDNADICRSCDLTFLTTRPNNIATLSDLAFKDSATIISCVAGFSILQLRQYINCQNLFRLMPCSPELLKTGNGFAALLPENNDITDLLHGLGIETYIITTDEQMNIWTAAMCLVAVFIQLEFLGRANEMDNEEFSCAYNDIFPFWSEIITRSKNAMPIGLSINEKKAFVASTATKRGITEAIVNAIKSGKSLTNAFEIGIKRCREIAQEDL